MFLHLRMFPIQLSKVLVSNRKLRNAARYFFWVKSVNGCDVFAPNKLSGPFTSYEKKEAIKTLLEANWIGLRRDGMYCLRGRKFFAVLLGLEKSTRFVDIPSEFFSDKRSWTRFVSAVSLTTIARSVRAHNSRKDRLKVTACSTLACVASDETPVSLDIVRRATGLSKASASRLRKVAAESGLVKVTIQLLLLTTSLGPIRMTPLEFAMFRSQSDTPGKFSLKEGILHEQYPSLVSMMNTKRIAL